jgi:AGCS family alanine or glycine:cation symporter
MTQINGITSAVNMAIESDVAFSFAGNEYTWATVIGGAIVTICAALVIIGGLKRISKVAEKIVPAMAIIYVFLGLSVLIMNATQIPAAFVLIFKSAFGWKAVAGGAAGFVLKQVMDSMQKGIARGIFSNEAGLGSAPIAAAPVKTEEPVEQGLVNMTGTVIDTLIVCTMTGLAIVIAFCNPQFVPMAEGLQGVQLTSAALSFDLGGDGVSVQFLLMLCLAFFAFTTILGWDYYSEKCLEYLSNGRMKFVMFYRVLYIVMIAIGPYFTVDAVFTIADITNGLMAIPNCIALIVLSGIVAKETKSYFDRYPTLS